MTRGGEGGLDMGVLEFKKKKEKFMQHNHGILSGHCCLYIKSN